MMQGRTRAWACGSPIPLRLSRRDPLLLRTSIQEGRPPSARCLEPSMPRAPPQSRADALLEQGTWLLSWKAPHS